MTFTENHINRIMKTASFIFLLLLNFIPIHASENLKVKILRKLENDKVVNYTVNKLIIQGNSTKTEFSKDTLFINIYGSASFQKNTEDSVWGYDFVASDSLIHPYFKLPQKTTKVYKNGKLLTALVSPKQNRYTEKRIGELKPEELELTVQGQLTDVLALLKDPTSVLRTDTLLHKQACYHFSTVKNGLPTSLFIAKKSLMPLMLRITTNTFQPFIEEYNYSNFSYSTVLNYSELSKSSIQSTPEKAVVKVNDILPGWELADLQGNNYSLKNPEKFKIIYLSMINCGPCQEAIPYVEKMYNEYNQSDSVEFVVFYPVDDKESLIRYVQRKNLKPNLVYNSSVKQEKRIEIFSYLNIGYPAFLIVDKENRVRDILSGFSKNIEMRVKNRLEKVIIK